MHNYALFLRQALSLNTKLAPLARPAMEILLSVFFVVVLQACKTVPGSYTGAEHPNLGPHV